MAESVAVKNKQNERTTYNINENVTVSTNNCIESQNVSIFDLAVLILSVFSIFIDLCTDLVLVIQYSHQGYITWAIGTFTLIFFPSLIVQFFSLRWHIVENTASLLHWLLHFCMLGIFYRYIQIIIAAFAAYRSKNYSDIQKVFLDQNDLCMLHLFESFLESAPQLVLQIYIIAMLKEWKFWTVLSALASLLSLAWALAAYTKAQRRARGNKNLTTWPGLLLQAVWRTGMLTSRISTLVLAAYCFGNYIFPIITIHWLAMTIWIIYQKTDFCETYWEEKIYNAVVGVIYCFCFFNLQEGQSRWRAFVFYLVIIFQNLTCLTVFLMWFGEKTPKLAVSAFIATIGGIIFGSAGMLLYYRFFHPSGPIKFFFHPQFTKADETSKFYSTYTLRSLKKMRYETQSDFHHKNTLQSSAKLGLKSETSFSDSVVIIEESLQDDSDSDIKILENWINEPVTKVQAAAEVSKTVTNETEADAIKRRAICSSVDLDKLLDSKTKSESEDFKLTTDLNSPVLSAHDYENLCAVNIAREIWGLRSWRGYSDIETWLHDDSTVHDRRLDTLTSTASSDFSGDAVQKENERTRQDDYIDAIADDLAQCESESNSDYALGRYSIDSFPTVYCLGALDPIFEEAEESSGEGTEPPDLKTRNGSASTLVATIEKIRMNTPTRNCYQFSEPNYGRFSLTDSKPKFQRCWRKTSAPKLQQFSQDRTNSFTEPNKIDLKHDGITKKSTKVEITDVLEKKERPSKKHSHDECEKSSEIDTCNKENISAVACKITHWNKIINDQSEKNGTAREKSQPKSKDNNYKNIDFDNIPKSLQNSAFKKIECK